MTCASVNATLNLSASGRAILWILLAVSWSFGSWRDAMWCRDAYAPWQAVTPKDTLNSTTNVVMGRRCSSAFRGDLLFDGLVVSLRTEASNSKQCSSDPGRKRTRGRFWKPRSVPDAVTCKLEVSGAVHGGDYPNARGRTKGLLVRGSPTMNKQSSLSRFAVSSRAFGVSWSCWCCVNEQLSCGWHLGGTTHRDEVWV